MLRLIARLLVVATYIITSVASLRAEDTPKCVGNVYVDKEKTTCAYDVTYAHRDTSRKQHYWSDAAVEALATIEREIGGPLNNAGNRYWRGGHRHSQTIRPSPKHSYYLRCAHSWRVLGERGVRDWDNKNKVTANSGYWYWELKRKGWSEGRSFYSAVWVWVSHNPAIRPDLKLCKQIAQTTSKKIVSSLKKHNKTAFPVIRMPMPSKWF